MTNEHDVEIARIGAALTVASALTPTGGQAFCPSLQVEAEAFLKRQFAVNTEQKDTEHKAHYLAGAPDGQCRRIIPRRGSTKLSDGIRCSKSEGHEGVCEFI